MNRAMILAALVFVPTVRAEVESGPKAGEKIAELKAFAVVGTVENKDVDYAKERGDEPTVYLFVNAEKFSRPMNKFMKTLDGKLEGIDDKARAIAVWVTADADKTKEFLPKVQGSVKYERTALGYYAGEAGKLEGWGLNPSAHLTVVVARKGKVVKSFAFENVGDGDVKTVEEALKEKK